LLSKPYEICIKALRFSVGFRYTPKGAMKSLSIRLFLLGLLASVLTGCNEKPWLLESNCPKDIQPLQLKRLLANIQSADTEDSALSLPDDTQFCIAFLTLNGTSTITVMGRGFGLSNALNDAQKQLSFEARSAATGLKLDLVNQVAWVDVAGILPQPSSLWGLATTAKQAVALLPGELLAARIIDDRQRYRPDRLAQWTQQHGQRLSVDQPEWQHRFTTHSWYVDATGSRKLFRGHQQRFELREQSLLTVGQQAGQYLSQALDEEGRFVYNYLAKTDRDDGAYNMLRHAGSIFALLEWYGESGDLASLQAAQRGLNYLWKQYSACPFNKIWPCIIDGGEIKLGGNALAVLAMNEHYRVTGDRHWLGPAQVLSEWMIDNQSSNGQFRPHKWDYPSGKASDFISAYYPAQTIFALLRLYRSDHDPRWLSAAEHGVDWLIEVHDANKTGQDHWLMYALRELNTMTAKPRYMKHVWRISEAILRSQNLDQTVPLEQRDWYGSYNRPPRSITTATRSEALVNAAWLASANDRQRLPAIQTGLCAAIGFQLQTQFRAENSLYLPKPIKAIGGFHRDLQDLSIRIDYVQHNLNAILGVIRLQRQQVIDCSEIAQRPVQ